eukprot:322834-Amphidinium_carterae.1
MHFRCSDDHAILDGIALLLCTAAPPIRTETPTAARSSNLVRFQLRLQARGHIGSSPRKCIPH